MEKEYKYVDPAKVISEETGDYFYQVDENISVELLNFDNLSRNRHLTILRKYDDYTQVTSMMFKDKTSDLWNTKDYFCNMIDTHLKMSERHDIAQPHCLDLENWIFFELDYNQKIKNIAVTIQNDKAIDEKDYNTKFNPHSTFDELYKNLNKVVKQNASNIFLETNTICWVMNDDHFSMNLNEGIQNSVGVIEYIHFSNTQNIGVGAFCKSTNKPEEREDMFYNIAYKAKQIFADYDKQHIAERMEKWRVTQSSIEAKYGLYFPETDYKIIRDDIAPDNFKVLSKYVDYDKAIQKHNELTNSNIQTVYDF